MSSIQDSTDLSLIFHSLRQRLARYLPDSSQRAQIILQSAALVQVTYATLKNIPYAFLSKELGTNDLGNMLSSRVTYMEAAVISVASTICNIAFTLLYTALSFATLGLSNSVNFSMKKHWHHVTYGVVSTGIALVGVVTPYWGGYLNVGLLYATLNMMKKCYGHDVRLFERPLLNEIKDITRNYAPIVGNYIRQKVNNDLLYQAEHKRSLEYIEGKIHTAERMDDLINLGLEVRAQWPRVGSTSQRASLSHLPKSESRAIHKHYE